MGNRPKKRRLEKERVGEKDERYFSRDCFTFQSLLLLLLSCTYTDAWNRWSSQGEKVDGQLGY